MSKDKLRQDKCFTCNQIWKRKRKSGAYEVAYRAETEDGYVTSTEAITRNENSDDVWLQTAAKCLKVHTNQPFGYVGCTCFLLKNLLR